MVVERQQHGVIVATYTYQNADGTAAYRVNRFDPKDFRQQHYDRGQWRSGLGAYKEQPLPYHLPRVLTSIAKNPDRVIFIVEGEKDSDNAARQLDLVTTCNNGGAGHWKAAQSGYLKGAVVGIVPDNDDAGRNHAAIAARYLHDAQAASVRVIVLPDVFGSAHVKDISDFIAAGGTRADLWQLYQAAPLYQPGDLDSWLIKPQAAAPRPIQHSPQCSVDEDTARYAAWARRALENVTSELAATPSGRFAALKAAANRLGTIAEHRLLTETECLAALVSACAANGYEAKYGQRVTEDRARFYFQSGLGHPCDLPTAEPDRLDNAQLTVQGALAINPDLFKHGLPDRLCAAIRRCFHQAIAPTLWIWLYAIAVGLIDANADIDAATLTDAAETLGFADPQRRQNVRRMFTTGLVEAEKSRILDTVLQITAIATESTPPNTVSRIGLRSAADIVSVVQQWLPYTMKEDHFPTEDRHKTRRDGEQWLFQVATLAVPERTWLDQDADAALADMAEQGDLHIDADAADRIAKAERATKSDRTYFAKIGTDTTVTPMPTSWTFTTAREFTAMRFRALASVDGVPRPQWQLAQILGVAKSSLPAYRKLAGLVSEPQILLIKVTTAEQAVQAASQQRGFLKVIETTSPDGAVQRIPYDLPTAGRVIAAAQQKGHEVSVHVQIASKQQIATDAQPKLAPRRKPVIELAHARESKSAAARPFIMRPANVPEVAPREPLPPAPPRVPGYSRKWITGQLVLNMKARGFTEQGDSIVHPSGEIVARGTFASLTYESAIEVARGRSLIESQEAMRQHEISALAVSMQRADQLCSEVSAAERAARLAGSERGVGRAVYLASLTDAERDAIEGFDRGDTW